MVAAVALGTGEKINLLILAAERSLALNMSYRPDELLEVDATQGPVLGEFVATLDQGDAFRATGAALFAAYESVRVGRGWRQMTNTVFGRKLREAVGEVGGHKIKSSGQVYVGVRVPS